MKREVSLFSKWRNNMVFVEMVSKDEQPAV